MAETNSCSNVQDVASQADQVPEIYIRRQCDRGSLHAPFMDAPVIDIRHLDTGPELHNLRHGLHSWGSFQAINHGMSGEFLEEVRRVVKEFFDLPIEEKLKYSRGEDEIEGYGNDRVVQGEEPTLDWIDRLQLIVYPEECRNRKYWPSNIERFREVIEEYTENVRLLSEAILKAMAKSLDLDENSFLNQYGRERMRNKISARLNYYPKCRNPELVLGVRPHTDGSVITILLPDKEVKGLQFLKDNMWFNAPIVPDALFVNLGDQAEITSNGIFKSLSHRVLTNSERERISVALFYLSDSEKAIEPLEKLITETQPRLYKTSELYGGVVSATSAMAGTKGSGSVEDVSCKGEVPERYIHKEKDGGGLDAPLLEAPVIDIGLLSSSSDSGPELKKLRHGLQPCGCFLAINHGMSAEFLEEVRQVVKQFFALPLEHKLKYSREEDEIEGYGNDMILSNNQILDWTDRLYLTVYPQQSRRLKYWPTTPQRFREVVDEYTENVRLISEKILKAMAKSLDLEDENSFLNQYGHERVKLEARFNFYPRCRNPDLVLGNKPHADVSAITLLLLDKEVEGLQFLKGDEWFNAPIVPDALLVNVGDQAEITSNGIFKSPVHRVLTNSERERISLAVFYVPDSEKEIEPLEKLINETRPRMYKTVKNFAGLYFPYYQQGRRTMEAARI